MRVETKNERNRRHRRRALPKYAPSLLSNATFFVWKAGDVRRSPKTRKVRSLTGSPGFPVVISRCYIRERQHALLLKDHVIAWLARLTKLVGSEGGWSLNCLFVFDVIM